MNDELFFLDNMEYTLHWINENYNKEMSVNEIAQRLYISPATFSRKFQKLTNKKFTDYINELRISHAKEDLENTNKSISDIAQQHGFGNVSVFSKVFKHYENTTPTVYRKEHSLVAAPAAKTPECLSISLKPSTNFAVPYTKVWNMALDLGDAVHLLHSQVQRHIVQAQKDLGIRYVRMCHIFSNALITPSAGSHTSINFTKLDVIFDFLLQHNLKPWIDLEKGTEPFVSNISIASRPNTASGIMEINDKFVFFEKFMVHLNSRYGAEQVSTWLFELWHTDYEDSDAEIDNYIHTFSHIYTILKAYAPKAKLGALGKSILFFSDFTKKVLSRWPASCNHPDFISIYSFPYKLSRPHQPPQRYQEIEFTQEVLNQTHEILRQCGMEDIPVYITEWNMTIYERNAVNDSCIRAAFLLQNAADAMKCTTPIVCHSISDITSPPQNDRLLLHGGSGLISRIGLPKPSYLALSFLNKMSDYCLDRGKGYIITTDRRKRFDVLLFNASKLPSSYFSKWEYEITDDIVLNNLINGQPDVLFSIDIDTGTQPRQYQVRKLRITPGENDVQSVVKKFGSYIELNTEDVQYIQAKTQPERQISVIETPNSKLHIDCQVKPFEIVYISFLPM